MIVTKVPTMEIHLRLTQYEFGVILNSMRRDRNTLAALIRREDFEEKFKDDPEYHEAPGHYDDVSVSVKYLEVYEDTPAGQAKTEAR